ncbi:MAG: ABC transporter ATP-binding protein [Clostridia bacterium]|nr:ABC transporter ATP-binding protein [Clostridia bacterium]
MLLKLEQLAVNYGSKPVLKSIDLSVAQGEIYAVLGSNGAGKTTLFRAIIGFIKPDNGRIIIDGNDSEKMSRKELSKLIAYVPQCHNCTFSYPVIDIVVMGCNSSIGAFGEPSQEHYARAREALGKLNIAHLEKRKFKKLSGGEKQLVLIARALVQRPKLIIMDEPTASLDFSNSINVLTQIVKLKSDNLSLLVTCHSPSQAKAFADKVLMIKDGKVYKDDKVQILSNKDVLHDLYCIEISSIEDSRIRNYITETA